MDSLLKLMSDTEPGSDYEVILEDSVARQARRSLLGFRTFCDALERKGEVACSDSESENPAPPLMLASFSQMAPGSEMGSSEHSFNSNEENPSVPEKMYVFPEEAEKEARGGTDDTGRDTDDSILEAHGEVKRALIEAVEQMEILKDWKQEKVALTNRVTSLEGTVDRLTKKNNSLQKVNENGAKFDRREKDKDSEEEEDRPLSCPNLQPQKSFSLGNTFLLVLAYSLVVGVVIYYNQTEADKKVELLALQIRTERWNSEQLLAKVLILETRLQASFNEIEKLNKVLYSPYSQDIYAIPAEADEDSKTLGCYIRLNSTTLSVCQRLVDELEKEAHENSRLKEQVSSFQGVVSASFSLFVALMATVIVYTLKSIISRHN